MRSLHTTRAIGEEGEESTLELCWTRSEPGNKLHFYDYGVTRAAPEGDTRDRLEHYLRTFKPTERIKIYGRIAANTGLKIELARILADFDRKKINLRCSEVLRILEENDSGLRIKNYLSYFTRLLQETLWATDESDIHFPSSLF